MPRRGYLSDRSDAEEGIKEKKKKKFRKKKKEKRDRECLKLLIMNGEFPAAGGKSREKKRSHKGEKEGEKQHRPPGYESERGTEKERRRGEEKEASLFRSAAPQSSGGIGREE